MKLSDRPKLIKKILETMNYSIDKKNKIMTYIPFQTQFALGIINMHWIVNTHLTFKLA